jgi:hypothetical protein
MPRKKKLHHHAFACSGTARTEEGDERCGEEGPILLARTCRMELGMMSSGHTNFGVFLGGEEG